MTGTLQYAPTGKAHCRACERGRFRNSPSLNVGRIFWSLSFGAGIAEGALRVGALAPSRWGEYQMKYATCTNRIHSLAHTTTHLYKYDICCRWHHFSCFMVWKEYWMSFALLVTHVRVRVCSVHSWQCFSSPSEWRLLTTASSKATNYWKKKTKNWYQSVVARITTASHRHTHTLTHTLLAYMAGGCCHCAAPRKGGQTRPS